MTDRSIHRYRSRLPGLMAGFACAAVVLSAGAVLLADPPPVLLWLGLTAIGLVWLGFASLRLFRPSPTLIEVDDQGITVVYPEGDRRSIDWSDVGGARRPALRGGLELRDREERVRIRIPTSAERSRQLLGLVRERLDLEDGAIR